MASLKAHEVENWLTRGTSAETFILFYGPDRGLVAERAKRLVQAQNLPLDDPFAVIRLDGPDLESDAGRLIDEARTVSMFGNERLIWVRNASSSKALAGAISDLCDNPPVACRIIVEAGDLKKAAGNLRAVAEGHRAAMAVPCYADRERDLERLIDEVTRGANLPITTDARQFLIDNLGADRLVSRGELEKLTLYAMGDTEIDLQHVLAIVGDASALSADTIADAVLEGDLAAMDRLMSRLISSGQDPFVALLAVQRTFDQLAAMRVSMESEGISVENAMGRAKPRIFFTRQKAFANALRSWRHERIVAALERLSACILQIRQRGELAVALTRQTLLALTVESIRGSRRR